VESHVFLNVTLANSGGLFYLSGGKYLMTVSGTVVSASRVGLQKACLTSNVFANVHTPLTGALIPGTVMFEVPFGQYRLLIVAAATNVNIEIARIPTE
jgi:hypothetical protein